MVERVIRTLKKQYVHRHRFESLQNASRVIADWFGFYIKQRPHQAQGLKTTAETFRLAAQVHYSDAIRKIELCCLLDKYMALSWSKKFHLDKYRSAPGP